MSCLRRKRLPSSRLPTIVFLGVLSLFPCFAHSNAATLKPKRFVTENGITVLVLEQPSIPIVAVQVLVRAGAILDPKGKAGLASMTASLLEEGTKTRTATEISDAVDFIGAGLSSRASKDFTSVRLRVLKKDIKTGFDLLSDILMHPKFDSKEIERVRNQTIGGILAEKDQPRAIARRAFQELVFRDHPYRHAVVGDETSVRRIKSRDLARFHQKYYRPNNIIIAIVGDIKASSAKQLVQDYFGKWKSAVLDFPKVSPVQPLQEKEIKRIDKDLTQATVILGHVGIHRGNPDYYAVLVMNYILGGGGFSSRMMSDIRDDRGLVYSIYSHFTANRFPGAFSVSLQTKRSSTQEAISGVLQQIKKIQNAPVRDDELSDAKAYLAGSFPLRIDTTRKAARLLASIEFHELGLDYFETYVEGINRVTRKDVLRVAEKYLDPEHYALVVVGKQSQITMDDNGEILPPRK